MELRTISHIETPKTDRRGGICKQVGVFKVRQLFLIKEGNPVPVAQDVEPETEFGSAWAIKIDRT